MITLVSAFLCGSKPKHSPEEYLGHFHRIADTGAPIILFLDPRTGWTSFPDTVTVFPICLTDTWIGRTIPEDVELPSCRGSGDTREYMMIQHTKTEFLRRASECNPYGTEWFAWVDFGLGHVFRDPEATCERLRTLVPPPVPCIRTAGIWSFTPDDLTSCVCWRFAGGFMLAHSSKIHAIDDAVAASVSRSLPRFAWEVNTWADVERRGLDLGWFLASHDDTIVPRDISGSERAAAPTSASEV